MSNLRDMADIANARLERQRDDEENQNDKDFNNRFTIVGVILALLAVIEPFAGWCTLEENRGYYFSWMMLDLILVAFALILLRESLRKLKSKIFKKNKNAEGSKKE